MSAAAGGSTRNVHMLDVSRRPSFDAGRESPGWVRISYASALALRLVSGRFSRSLTFGGVNILLSYADGCLSDCGYCGLARTRPVAPDAERSFIRVQWPLVATDDLVSRLERHESTLSRLCISMVTHARAFEDTLALSARITRSVDTPLSVLVAPSALDEQRLLALRKAGVQTIGIGLDAVTEELFGALRTDVPHGGLRWERYQRTIEAARRVFGPWQVNCHTLVGLGESDRELIACFTNLLEHQVHAYLFCLHPEPGSRMADHPRPSLRRWRRIQLAKLLLEERGLDVSALRFDDGGALVAIHAPQELVDEVIADGHAFMTNGCAAASGAPGCTRPMGSWRASEPPRDFPWRPSAGEIRQIRSDLELEELIHGGPWPSRDPELCAPPAAGRAIDTIDKGDGR